MCIARGGHQVVGDLGERADHQAGDGGGLSEAEGSGFAGFGAEPDAEGVCGVCLDGDREDDRCVQAQVIPDAGEGVGSRRSRPSGRGRPSRTTLRRRPPGRSPAGAKVGAVVYVLRVRVRR